MTREEILLRLVLGNLGDETALRNICEAHDMCVDELTPREREYLYATNSFYYSAEEFNTIHEEETDEEFRRLLEDGIIVATTDGYVWVDCV